MLTRETVAGVRSTSGDGTAVIDAPGLGKRVHIHFVALVPATQGAAVTATIKSGSTTLFLLPMGSSVSGVTAQFELVGGENEAIYVALSADEEVHYALSYRVVDEAW